jgi:hypothetical protein
MDKSVLAEGQRCPSGRDASVGRTYLSKQPKTFLSGLGEGRCGEVFKDRGRYEAEIIKDYGSNMIDLFLELDKIDATAVEQLCRKAKSRTLSSIDISAAQLRVAQNRGTNE